MPNLSMVFDVLAIDRASEVFGRVGASAEAAGAKVETATTGISNAGSRVAQGLGLAAAAAAVVSVKMAGDFQQSLTKLATTAGESQKNLKMVGDGMLAMAGQVGIGADELAKGMYTVESSGIHGADALNVLKAAAQGAKQENADLSKVTDAVTTALHDYSLPASDAAKITSQMVTAVSSGKTTFDELTGSLHSVTPLAAALHIPFADIIGSLAAMTASGESADQATQNMADALRHLQAPTGPMIAELAQLGITATDLSKDLSTKGLSGTIQEVSQAILQHMGPSGQVLLGTFNQSKIAAQDAKTMFDGLPSSLQKLAKSYSDGSLSVADWRAAIKGMPADQQTLAQSWKTAEDRANGFSQALKSGKPDAQQYSAALQAAMGTSAGLTVALQLTGEHTDAVNESIKKISASTGDASGNIKGWSEVQANCNQQMAEAAAKVQAMAIEFGQHMLPALTGVMGYVNRDVLPGLEHLGSAASGVAHWFGELPGPIKDFALALAALRVVDMVGGFDKLSASMQRFREQMAVQDALRGMEAAAGAAEGGVTRLGTAASLTAQRGFGALKAGATGLMNMFGGPWGLVLAGAVGGIMAIKSAIDQHDAAVKKATQDVAAWQKAMAVGPAGGSAATEAAGHLADLQKQIDSTKAKLSELTGATTSADTAQRHFGAIGVATSSGAVQTQKDILADLIKELNSGSDAWQKQLASMTPVEVATAKVAAATKDLHDTQAKFPANSSEVEGAARRLADAQSALAYDTDLANDASKTQLQRLQDLANKQLASVNSGLAAQQAQYQFTDAVAQLNAQVADGSLKGNALAEAQNGLAQSAISAAQAAGQQAADQDKANGVTNTANDVNAAMLKSLQDNEKFLTGPAKDAIDQQIQILQNATVKTGSLSDAISKMGLTTVTESDSFRKEWGNNVQVLHGATQAQIKDLEGLGYTVKNLPNGDVIVSADTKAARQALTQLSTDYTQYSINVGVKLGSGHFVAADGGILPGYTPGKDVHHFTSPTGGSLSLSGGEAIMRPEFTSAVGSGWVNSMNKAARAGGAAGVRSALGFANGGIFDMFLTAKVGVSPSAYSAAEKSIHQMVDAAAAAYAPPIPGAPANVLGNAHIVQSMAAARGWTGAEWNALYALVMRESGFRNTAQNPTSTAYGMFQFLNSTWAGYGGGKTSDPTAQTRMGLSYIAGKYGDPLRAWAHETKFGWYKNGTNFVPSDQLAMLHKGEAVVPASKNQGAPYKDGHTTVVGVQNLGPVTYSDTERIAATSFRHAAMAAARFQ